MKKPLLSVIIPVYNTASSINRIADRVLKQKMRDLELVLIDDGSTDDTPRVLSKIAKSSRRVRVVTQKNAGPSGARNAGLRAAAGEFILFLDSDDDISPQMIPTMMRKQQSTGADVVTCAIKEVYPSGQTFVPDIKPRLVKATEQDVVVFALSSMGRETSVVYNPTNRIMRRDIITKNRLLYRTDLRFGEDLAFNLEYLRHARKIAVMSQPFYTYYHSTATSVFSESSIDYKYRQENTKFLWEFAETSDDPTVYNLATWVQTRWFLSFCKAVFRSSLSRNEKRQRVSYACRHEKFKKPNAIKALSFSQKLIIKTVMPLIKKPKVFYFLVSIVARG